MALFGGRGKSRDIQASRRHEAIGAFWQWWSQDGMARSSSALADSEPSRIVADLCARIEAVSPDLVWEFAKGDTSMHTLVITADGDPALRALARRLLDAAPESDVFWSYADARPALADVGEAVLELDGTRLPLNETRIGVRRSGTRIDVQVYHPLLSHISAGARATFCFLAVDAAVGETMTETWIGELHPAEVEPIDAFGLAGLRSVVRDLASDFEGPQAWVQLEGVSEVGPVQVLARVPLAAASAPTFDRSVIVGVSYTSGESGLPTEAARADLDSFRTHLIDRLEQQGEHVAMVLVSGRCQLHFYVDSTRTGAAQLAAAARAWPGKVSTDVEDDPGWANVAHLRG